ncbi:hypothetical protein F8280_08470 [Micromonospora noduli]|uniref:hypothetical protein n=1 Tax=Micromonospora TaxID=1873 RepID=UPI000DC00EF0|nr:MULTISPECIES: hypothetical protein [Micromonospora]KAB1927181.1 hypothetical protein F8280_08470 [Micromonospora noduli]RAO61638.1 hypothetical protein LUPAC06_00841 [Micromonospora saelicesensis]
MTAILNPTGAAPLSPPPPRRAAETPTALVTGAPVGPVGPVLELPGTPPTALVPVVRDGRAIGAYVLSGGRVRYRPVTNPDRLLAAATGAFAVAVLTAAVAVIGRRKPPAIGAVTMGPGGWVSLRGVRAPALRPTTPRPWWARALRAHRLVVER